MSIGNTSKNSSLFMSVISAYMVSLKKQIPMKKIIGYSIIKGIYEEISILIISFLFLDRMPMRHTDILFHLDWGTNIHHCETGTLVLPLCPEY